MADNSKFFDPDRTIKDDMQKVENAKSYIDWIQSFSKKIVVVTFLLYLVLNVVILIMSVYQACIGTASFDTIYTEINETFRVVIGGYLIKAGIENAVKIGGNQLVSVSNSKIEAMKEKYGFVSSDEDCGEDDEENSEI